LLFSDDKVVGHSELLCALQLRRLNGFEIVPARWAAFGARKGRQQQGGEKHASSHHQNVSHSCHPGLSLIFQAGSTRFFNAESKLPIDRIARKNAIVSVAAQGVRQFKAEAFGQDAGAMVDSRRCDPSGILK
jgi:hypothetical protein